MKKVLFTVNIPSPYRVDFFNELGKHCDLTVLFEKQVATDRDLSWKNYEFKNFKGIFLKGISVGAATAVCFSIKKHLKENKYDVVVCANFTSPTGIIAVRYMKKHGIEFYLESDGGFVKSGKGFRERLKKSVIKDAKAYFSTGTEHDKYYIAYGAKREKLIRYPFSSLRDRDVLKNVLSSKQKDFYKQKLGIKEKIMVLTVGQFIPRKGFDVLLKSIEYINQSVGVYFVGGVPTEEYLKIVEDLKLKNVFFEGFKTKEQLKEYYMAADLFVLPTREDIWGLVINEAMANALPIITTTACVAGIELVKDECNGFLVQVEDEVGLGEKINSITDNAVLREQMAEASLQAIRPYTIEKMALKHIEVFNGKN